MAYFQRINGRVKAYYHDTTSGKNTAIPRALIKHLDGASNLAIRQWLEEWEQQAGISRQRQRTPLTEKTEELNHIFASYQEQRRLLRNITPSTLRDERTFWKRHVLPYFLTIKGEEDVRKWHAHTASFSLYLMKEHKLAVKSVKQAGWLLERFGKHLVAASVLKHSWHVPLPILNRKATTPLELALTPSEILKAAETIPPEWALALLLGYFASLRPGETFALTKADFLTGDGAKSVAKTYTRLNRVGLGSGLTVRVDKALKNEGIIGSPKTHHSYGYVNVWDVNAARLIASIVKDMPDGRLFHGHKTSLFKGFKAATVGLFVPGVFISLHDLRRASALYLGRTKSIEVMLLQDHMRHSDLQTTMIYTRRPLEEGAFNTVQNWGDVV